MQIKKEQIREYNKKYSENIINTISRNALNKTKISDLVKNSTQSEFVQNNFSINIQKSFIWHKRNKIFLK